jgi:hypothetical protein
VSSSTLESLRALPASERRAILSELSDEQAAQLFFDWTFWARQEQLPPAGRWRIWLVLAGRGYGKTRIGAEWVREQVKTYEHVNLVAKSRDEYRDVMVEGESGILACCPPWERPEWLATRRMLKWPNGARSLCFTAEEPEQLRGPQHQRLWGDEVAKWPYMRESFDMAMLGLRLGPDPRCLLTTTPKPVRLLRDLLEDETVIVTKGSTYDNRANLAPEFFDQVIRQYEGTRLGRQELEAELLLDEGLAYRLVDGVHVVPPFDCPTWWKRFEGHDHGMRNACAWLSFATDGEGNHVAQGSYYAPGDVDEHAAGILSRRRALGEGVCFTGQDIKGRWARKDWRGQEVTLETEYADAGISLVAGQADRRAGYARLTELLRCDSERFFPDWHEMAGQTGAPRLFVQDREDLQPLIEQLRDAPIEDPDSPLSRWPGEAVDQEWESREGHAHAAARYALMSRPSPGLEPKPIPTDPRARLLYEHEQRLEAKTTRRSYRR